MVTVETGGTAEQRRVVGKRILRFRDAHGQLVSAQGLDVRQGFLCSRCVNDTVRAVNLAGNRLNLFLHGESSA